MVIEENDFEKFVLIILKRQVLVLLLGGYHSISSLGGGGGGAGNFKLYILRLNFHEINSCLKDMLQINI